MAEKTDTKNGESKPDNKYTGEQSVKKEKMISLTFRGNRCFEFKHKRIYYRFEGRETLQVPKTVLNDPEFIRIRNQFIVKE